MVDTLGLPTVFFTHSAADLHWPELTKLTNPDDGNSMSNRIKNPAISDWFFYHRIEEFIKTFYILGATDYWLRFEWRHRGRPHVHGLSWLPNNPDVDQLACPETPESVKQQVIQYANTLISTMNPGVFFDGSSISDTPLAKTDPHICAKPYSEVTDFYEDLKKSCRNISRSYPLFGSLLPSKIERKTGMSIWLPKANATALKSLSPCRCPIYVDFREGGKPEYPEKNSRSIGKLNCGNSLS